MTVNRHNRVHDYMMKSARYLVNYGLTREIGTLVGGYHPDGKQDAHIAEQSKLCPDPPWTTLETLCEHYGWQYVEQAESYTSPASFLDGKAIPVWNGTHQEITCHEPRVKRRLYRTKEGLALNADMNGAANILRKSNHRLTRGERVARGFGQPLGESN